MTFKTEPFVVCDECGARYSAPIVRKEMDRKGWIMRHMRDYCPKCAPAIEAKHG